MNLLPGWLFFVMEMAVSSTSEKMLQVSRVSQSPRVLHVGISSPWKVWVCFLLYLLQT